MTPHPRAKVDSPSRQLAAAIAKFDPAVARVVRAAMATLRRRFTTAVELVYDGYNALAIGWGATDRMSDVIVSLAVYSSGVNLYFMHGLACRTLRACSRAVVARAGLFDCLRLPYSRPRPWRLCWIPPPRRRAHHSQPAANGGP